MESVSSTAYLLQHTAIMMLRQSDQVLQERLGIGMSQYRILMLLQSDPAMRQRKLADRLGQTEASISRQIKLLSEKGFLVVGVNPKSRREHRMELTPKGVKITEAAKDVLDGVNRPVTDSLSEKQRKQLAEALAVLHERTCAPGRPFACDHSYKIEV